MKLASVDGQPVVYSLGIDGRDDGGRKIAKTPFKPGDHVLRFDR